MEYNAITSVLGLDALLASDDAQNFEAAETDNRNDGQYADREESDKTDEPSDNGAARRTPVFDEDLFYPRHEVADEELGRLYYNNTTWIKRRNLFDLSMGKLFFPAKKHPVSQLCEHNLTAYLGQYCRRNWWPDLDQTLTILMYDNLPESSSFARIFTCAVAWK